MRTYAIPYDGGSVKDSAILFFAEREAIERFREDTNTLGRVVASTVLDLPNAHTVFVDVVPFHMPNTRTEVSALIGYCRECGAKVPPNVERCENEGCRIHVKHRPYSGRRVA
jgi:hypothetical protein